MKRQQYGSTHRGSQSQYGNNFQQQNDNYRSQSRNPDQDQYGYQDSESGGFGSEGDSMMAYGSNSSNRSYSGSQNSYNNNQTSNRGSFYGKAPKGYSRSDDKIREDVCERLMSQGQYDPSEIEVQVEGGKVTLQGSVDSRQSRLKVEELADQIFGVSDIENKLQISKQDRSQSRSQNRNSIRLSESSDTDIISENDNSDRSDKQSGKSKRG